MTADLTQRGPLTPEGLYPNRDVMHRNMGPPEMFPCCSGRGVYLADLYDPNETYCACACGTERARVENDDV